MRRILVVSAALLLFSSSAAHPDRAAAQVAPADSAAVLLQAAAHFRASGEPAVAQAIYRLILERFADTPAAAEARSRLATVSAAGTAGNGKVELQVWTTLYGLWLGIAVPGALGADDSEAYGVGLLAGGPVGFLAGKAISRGGTITEGQARAITLGGSWGTWQGYGWTEILDLGGQSLCYDDPYYGGCYDSYDDGEEKFAGMVLGGLAGIAAGALLSRGDISPGVATSANFGALWGSWFGFAGAYLAGEEDDANLAATLLVGNAGLVSAALLASRYDVSRNRARLVSIYGVIGGLSGLGLDLLVQPDDEKVAVGIPLAGSIIGLALGVGNTRDFDAARLTDEDMPGTGLLNVSDGRWSLGTPIPLPRMLELDGPRGPLRKPALGLTLLNARFF